MANDLQHLFRKTELTITSLGALSKSTKRLKNKQKALNKNRVSVICLNVYEFLKKLIKNILLINNKDVVE